MKRPPLFRLFLLTLFLLMGNRQATAETLPPFHLESFTQAASLIVEGDLDATGTFKVSRVIKGNPNSLPFHSTLHFAQGQEFFAGLPDDAKTGTLLHAVAFLQPDEENQNKSILQWSWHPYGRWCGLVALTPPRIFYFDDEGRVERYLEGRSPYRSIQLPQLTAAAFLAALSNTVRDTNALDSLLARPASAQRLTDLLAFLDGHLESRSHYWGHASWAFYSRLTLRREEQQVIVSTLQALSSATDPQALEKQAKLLDFLGSAARSPLGFDVVATFLPRSRPTPVREAALECLSRLDPTRAVQRYLPLMTLDDPALEKMVELIIPDSTPQVSSRVSREAAEALVRLSGQIRQIPQGQRPPWTQLDSQLIHQLANFGQPLPLEELHQWAISNHPNNQENARRFISTLTGLDCNQDLTAWDAWWPKAQPFLQATYNLATAQGRASWYHAYTESDPATRRILIRLWHFEPVLNETALLQAASHPPTAEAAKAVLSHFWECQRLSPAARESIVARFLDLKLVQLLDFWEKENRLEFQIIATRNFTFPSNAWIDHGASIAVGNEKHRTDLDDGTLNLEGSGPIVLGVRGGGLLEGPPVARAILEVQQQDYSPTAKDRIVVWKHRWTLPPLPIPPRTKPKPRPH